MSITGELYALCRASAASWVHIRKQLKTVFHSDENVVSYRVHRAKHYSSVENGSTGTVEYIPEPRTCLALKDILALLEQV